MRYREIIEAIKNDDDMFSTSSTLATGAKQAIKQIEDPYLRTVRRVRELAKTKFGIKTRVSSVPKSASRGRATFWFGDYVRDSNDPYDKAPEAPPVAQEIKAELERQGFECKFTGSGWLSVLVPPAYSDLLREENDEELFGRPGGKFAGMTGQEVIDHWDELQQELYGYEAYWDDDNDPEFLQKENELKALMRYARIRFGEGFYQYLSNWGEHSDAQYARHRERSNADPFSNRRYREDPRVTKAGKLHKQDALGLRNDIKARIGTHTQPVLPESNDDDMFGSSTRPDSKVIAQDLELWLRRRQSSSRRPIIPSSENYVKQVIAAFNQSFLKGVETWREYPLYGNTDIKYDIREYLENSLNVNLMDYVDQVNESDEPDDDLFGGNRLSTTLADKFEFPESGDLGYAMGGGGIGYGNGNSTDGLVIVSRGNNQIAFIPDFTYFDDNPTQEDLESLFHDEDTEQFPLSLQNVQKFLTLDENDESDEDLFGDGQQKVYVVTAPDDEILGMFDDIREAIAHAKKQVPIYLEDGWADDDLITVYKQNWGEESGVPVAHFPITDDPIDESNDDDDMFAKRGIERVNMRSIEIDGIDHHDAPDYTGAHVAYAEFNDGTALDDAQLDWLTDELGSTGELHELIYDYIYESDESDDDLFAAPTIRFGDFFNEYDEDKLFALGFSFGDYPEQDVDIINHYLEDGPVNWRVLKLTDASGQGDDIVLHLDRLSRLG